jgi:hypothetical protein
VLLFGRDGKRIRPQAATALPSVASLRATA